MTAELFEETHQLAQANGIEIAYDKFGDPNHPAVLLIMGLGAQMIDWREEFCMELANHGYLVIRFDNRDCGLSEKFGHAGKVNLPEIIKTILAGKRGDAAYGLEDMADDAIGLLDFLEIGQAHIVGLSMGGMIAQTMALRHPERMLTLTSIMSSTNEADLPQPSPEAAALLSHAAPQDRAEYIEYALENSITLGGSAYTHDEDLYRAHAGRRYDRGIYTEGFGRQLAAVLTAKGRREALKSLEIPTLVIHGTTDPLIPVECGVDTAQAIPGSNLKLIEGWGHSLPPTLWPTLIKSMVDHFSIAMQ